MQAHIGQKERKLKTLHSKRLSSNWALIKQLLITALELSLMFVTVTIWIIVLLLLNLLAMLLKPWAGLSTTVLNTFDRAFWYGRSKYQETKRK